MKKVQSLFFFLFLPLITKAFVGEAIIDGIKYNIITKAQTAEVLANNYSGDIVIPASIEYENVVCSVTGIGNDAFQSCSSLTSVTIPNSVTSIGNYAFQNCSSLTTITIPNSVTTIGDYAFENTGLTSFIMPNSMITIGQFAFQFCRSLTTVTVPNSVTAIGKGAFNECSGLSSVHISDLEAWFKISFGSGSANPVCRAHHLFLNGEELKDLIIPNTVTTIGKFTFYKCSSLTSVIIPNSVTSILKSAFFGCDNITSVTLSSNLTSFSEYAFSSCNSLKSITIPNSVTSIGNYAFDGCSALTSLTIGSGVKSIGNQSFAHCNELADVYCWSVKVPSTSASAFIDSYIDYATLHVPDASVEAYKSTAPWSGFKNIISLRDDDTPKVPKCDKPNIIKEGNKLWFECGTPGATFKSKITPNVEEQEFVGSEVVFQTGAITYTLTVVASADGYEDSDPVNMTLTIDRNDVNQDGTVDVADIATIISKMAGK